MKRFTRFCTLLMVLVTVFSLAVTANAESSVTYDGKANKFIFEPGTRHSPTNLFDDFQNVMPGDTIQEHIVIKNSRYRNIKIRVYMRSKGAQKGTEDFLSQLDLKVRQRGKSVLFDAPADQTGKLTDWTYLGTVYSGGKIDLDVTLKVPITMGNEYQNDIGYIDWEFKVEELPVEDTDPSTPKTGDVIITYVAILVLSAAALLVLFLIVKRKKNNAQ